MSRCRVAAGLLVVMLFGASARAADPDALSRAQQLAWAKKFAEAEEMYRDILRSDPSSRAAQLGVARVVMWQGRYRDAIALFERIAPQDVETIEGRATAEYWSGDYRSAARDFRRVLAIDPAREFSTRSLAEIDATARPSQRVTVDGVQDDQPVDAIRSEIGATFFSDPQTRWGAAAGVVHVDAGRIGSGRSTFAAIENQTVFGRLALEGRLGAFRFADGETEPIGRAALRYGMRRYGAVQLSVERREELASATALRTHATSTTTALRWSHDRNWIAAVEASHRRWFDGNDGIAAVAYLVAPVVRRERVTLWAGASSAARDTDESRFALTAMSSTREGAFYRYQYRGEYDPYWTPIDLFEARAVFGLDYVHPRATVRLHADGGWARDRGRAFGPDSGPTPLPAQTFAFTFDRTYKPFRIGVSADAPLAAGLRVEVGVERSVTVDYRSTSVHASLVRRR